MNPLTEADTRAKLIDPALHKKGWTEDLIHREETERGIDIIAGKARRRGCAERVLALNYKHGDWLKSLPQKTKNTLRALTKQFEKGGIEELENPYVFNAPEVTKAGGLDSLKILGEPKDVINETKKRLFAP